MTPDVAVSLATFVIVFMVLSRLGSARPPAVAVDPDVVRARQLISTKIDHHAEALTERYREACERDPGGDRLPDGFARAIEGFLGNVLLPELELEHAELGPAVREVLTLEREHVYALVLARVQSG